MPLKLLYDSCKVILYSMPLFLLYVNWAFRVLHAPIRFFSMIHVKFRAFPCTPCPYKVLLYNSCKLGIPCTPCPYKVLLYNSCKVGIPCTPCPYKVLLYNSSKLGIPCTPCPYKVLLYNSCKVGTPCPSCPYPPHSV